METNHAATPTLAWVERVRAETGLSLTQIAKRAGIAPSTLTRFAADPVKNGLAMRTVAAISKATGVPVDMAPAQDRRTPPSNGRNTLPNRFRAVRDIIWRSHGGPVRAAHDLGITLEEMAEIESGHRPPSFDVLARLSALADCPIGFLRDGQASQLRASLAARLAFEAPELVPSLLTDSEDALAPHESSEPA